MKKVTVLLLISLSAAFLFSAFSPIGLSQAQSSGGDVKVVSYSWYISDFTGNLIVVGEVQNTGTATLGNVVTRPAVIYTSDNQPQGTQTYALIYATGLLPGKTAPFYMEYTAETSLSGNMSWVALGVDHIDFSFYTETTDTQPYDGLQIMGSQSSTASGNFTVTGVVVNRGTMYPENVWVVGAFYDASGKVIAVGYSNYLSPHYLPPNEAAPFVFVPSDPTPAMTSQIANFNLEVLSSGVVATPPTPSPSAPTTGTPSAPASESAGPSASASQGDGSGSEPSVTIPMSLVYALVAAVVVVVVIVALAVVLRRGRKTESKAA
ncbi:MAG: hypothetical protein ACE14S_09225 [Candidatus Bathyarchaeia archaeon]